MSEKALTSQWKALESPIEHDYLPKLNATTSMLVVAMVAVVVLAMPHGFAFADDVPQAIQSIIGLISSALKVVGIGLGVWGAIKVGTAVSNGSGATGNELSEGIGRIAGGILIFLAASYFGNVITEAGF